MGAQVAPKRALGCPSAIQKGPCIAVAAIATGVGEGQDPACAGQPWANSHYGYYMAGWHMLFAMAGQRYDATARSLELSPRYSPPYSLPVLVPRTKLEDVDPSVPLLLHKTDVNLIRTDARGMQVLVNPALTLVLHVGAARVHIYRMNEEAVTVMHQRVPLELLVRALLARPRRRYTAGGERAAVWVQEVGT